MGWASGMSERRHISFDKPLKIDIPNVTAEMKLNKDQIEDMLKAALAHLGYKVQDTSWHVQEQRMLNSYESASEEVEITFTLKV